MKEIQVTVNKINTSIQNDALDIAGIEWKDVAFFRINGNVVSIFIEDENEIVVCEFCGIHTNDITHHILARHPEEQ